MLKGNMVSTIAAQVKLILGITKNMLMTLRKPWANLKKENMETSWCRTLRAIRTDTFLFKKDKKTIKMELV